MQALFAIGVAADKISIHKDGESEVDLDALDVAFIKPDWNGWYHRLPAEIADTAIDYLTHRITKRPQDLLAHVHRIVAIYYTNNTNALYGALLDLYIVLDKKGFRLRQRLLNKVAPRLPSEQRVALRNGLLFGIKSVEEVPFCVGSCFNAQLHDVGAVVVQTGEQIKHEFSVLDEALDLINSGFLDEARMILEEAIMIEPGSFDLNSELLNLFRCTKDKDAFFSAVERFEGLPLAARDGWAELERHFVEGQGV